MIVYRRICYCKSCYIPDTTFMQEYYIFPIPEIEHIILDKLEYCEYPNIALISKYYHDLIYSYPFIKEMSRYNRMRCNENIRLPKKINRKINEKDKSNRIYYNFARACIRGYLLYAQYLYYEHIFYKIVRVFIIHICLLGHVVTDILP